MKTGFVGLGAMGSAMARNLAFAGHLATLWNRTRSVATELARELEVKPCDSPAELAGLSDVVCICVSADQDVLEIVTALSGGLKPGSIVVDFSTVSSRTAVQAAKQCDQKKTGFLDSPVSGGVEGARNGTLAMMVGGDSKLLETINPILQSMGQRIVHMGPVGAGQATKAVNQIMAAGINQAVSEALAFGAHQGLPMDSLIDVIENGAAGNWFLQHRGRTMTQNTFKPGFKLNLHHKDLAICKNMAQEIDFSSRVIDSTLDDYAQLMEQGFGNEDISALYRLKRPQ